MKVFLSWSGEKSRDVALAFRDWLPSVIQSLEPYVSSVDIEKGSRWAADLAKELEDSSFGILCVTRENQAAPWLNFEAGALSKAVDKAFVSPFLFDLERDEVDADGPLPQFQSTTFSRDDVGKLVETLNRACGDEKLADKLLDQTFSVWWPHLESTLHKIKSDATASGAIDEPETPPAERDLLREILYLSQQNQVLLRESGVADLPKSAEELRVALDSSRAISESLEHRLAQGRKASPERRPEGFDFGRIDDAIHAASNLAPALVAFQLILPLLRDELPWLYDLGRTFLNRIHRSNSRPVHRKAARDFIKALEIATVNPELRMTLIRKEVEDFVMGLVVPRLHRYADLIADGHG